MAGLVGGAGACEAEKPVARELKGSGLIWSWDGIVMMTTVVIVSVEHI